jgi:Zinc carboxypeptidase/RTX calcium-binding nonapeptide repeat (4 copies)
VAWLLLAIAPAARADSLLAATVSAGDAVDRDCTTRELAGAPGVDSRSITAPSLAMIEARLDGTGGDWDVAVIDAESGATVAGSAYRGSNEVAQGFVTEGQELVVQACRRSGGSESAELTVDATEVEPGPTEPSSLVNVATPTGAAKSELQTLGLDVTEHAGDDFMQVVTHGEGDLETLREAGFSYSIQVKDLVAQSARHREAEAQYARSVRQSSLPSGRETYRRLFDYSEELKALAEANPDLVKPFTLPFTTYEGRPVEGIEITTSPNAVDGKPVFLNMALHHAREWPSGEHAMEWAYELINGYRAGDPRVVGLVQSTRTIILPVVNPDGFNMSREAGEINGHGAGQGGDDIMNFAASPNEYRRKNCRFLDDSEGGSCVQPSAGLAEPGVDPNRNYGGFWGGPGASTTPVDQDYRGPGPFSEPETQNIRHLISTHQVTALITNHTFSALVLRPPGLGGVPNPVDEPIYKALGDAMAAQNGYVSQHGYELYDTTGTTEDWSYYATGGLGYTFEIGCNGTPPDNCIGNFHPPFPEMVAEYDGTSPLAQAVGGGGNREAFFLAQEAAADPARHSVIAGNAPGQALLRLQKTFLTPTSPVLDAEGEEGEVQFLEDHLETKLDVPDSGPVEWHVNPSTRPLVAQEVGRPANGDPSPEQTFSGTPLTTTPCADFETTDETCWNDHAFTVPPQGGGVDNAKATVALEWSTPASDWDMKVFRDSNGDGSSVGETDQVGQSAQGTTNAESTTFAEPVLQPGNYVVRVINFAAVEPYDGTVTFEGPDPHQPAQTETWGLSCEFPEGNVVGAQDVLINRGEQQTLDLGALCKIGAADAKLACKTAPTVKGSAKKDKLKGTPGSDVIAAKGGRDRVRSGKGDDVICLGRGRDKGKAGSGGDLMLGNGGADVASGGGGGDELFGNRSPDRLRGGPGKDRCKGGPGKDQLQSC